MCEFRHDIWILCQLLFLLGGSFSLGGPIIPSLHHPPVLVLISTLYLCMLPLPLFSSLCSHSTLFHNAHSVFTQGSCDPYSPVIILPVLPPSSHACFHLIPSCCLCQRALRVSKSSFLSICLSTYPSVLYLSHATCVFLQSRDTRTNHSVSTLLHQPPPHESCLSIISLELTLSLPGAP